MAEKMLTAGELRHIADQLIAHRKRELGTSQTDEEIEHEVFRTLEALAIANRTARLFERGGVASVTMPDIRGAEPKPLRSHTLCQAVALLLRNCVADTHPGDVDHVIDYERVNFAPALQASELVEWAANAEAAAKG